MSKYAGMSNDRAADEYAYDEGKKQLREEAIYKRSMLHFRWTFIDGTMPDNQPIGEFLGSHPKFQELLQKFDWRYFDGEKNKGAFAFLYSLAYELIAAECDQVAEDEVDGN